MRRRFALCAALVSIAFSLSCSVNLLENFANKNTDEAIFTAAKADLNDRNYDAALLKFNSLKPGYLTDREMAFWKASAYGGKCGIRFFTFVGDFTAQVGSTLRLFPFLVKEFVGGTPARIADCTSAQTLIESIGAVGTRTVDENFLQVLIGFAKMGNLLSLYTDANQNGVADPGIDLCLDGRASAATAPVGGNFFDADLREFAASLTRTLANMTAISSSFNFGTAALSGFTTACGVVNFCAKTDPLAFSIAEILAVQSLLKENATVGLGTVCVGDTTACHCP